MKEFLDRTQQLITSSGIYQAGVRARDKMMPKETDSVFVRDTKAITTYWSAPLFATLAIYSVAFGIVAASLSLSAPLGMTAIASTMAVGLGASAVFLHSIAKEGVKMFSNNIKEISSRIKMLFKPKQEKIARSVLQQNNPSVSTLGQQELSSKFSTATVSPTEEKTPSPAIKAAAPSIPQ